MIKRRDVESSNVGYTHSFSLENFRTQFLFVPLISKPFKRNYKNVLVPCCLFIIYSCIIKAEIFTL